MKHSRFLNFYEFADASWFSCKHSIVIDRKCLQCNWIHMLYTLYMYIYYIYIYMFLCVDVLYRGELGFKIGLGNFQTTFHPTGLDRAKSLKNSNHLFFT